HTRFSRDWSSDVCSSDLSRAALAGTPALAAGPRAPAALLAAGDGDDRAGAAGLAPRHGPAGGETPQGRVNAHWRRPRPSAMLAAAMRPTALLLLLAAAMPLRAAEPGRPMTAAEFDAATVGRTLYY